VRPIHVAFVHSQPAHAPSAPPLASSTSQTSPIICLKHGGPPMQISHVPTLRS
jgi:hypothetical protein